jgi:hypothetical protein
VVRLRLCSDCPRELARGYHRGDSNTHCMDRPDIFTTCVAVSDCGWPKVSAAASDKQALQTYRDAEALLRVQDELHQLVEINNNLTLEIHRVLMAREAPSS